MLGLPFQLDSLHWKEVVEIEKLRSLGEHKTAQQQRRTERETYSQGNGPESRCVLGFFERFAACVVQFCLRQKERARPIILLLARYRQGAGEQDVT